MHNIFTQILLVMVSKEIRKRQLLSLIDSYADGNKSEFARMLGVSPQGISTWLARGSFDYELIYTKCESISADWLLTGAGNMIAESEIDFPGLQIDYFKELSTLSRALAHANETMLLQQKFITSNCNTEKKNPPPSKICLQASACQTEDKSEEGK